LTDGHCNVLNAGHAWNNLGTAYRAEGRQTDALDAFDHSLAIRPGYADAHFNRGNASSSLQRFPESEASYRKALELAPERADVLANLGFVLLQEGRAREALPFVERAASLSPRDISARINLVAALITTGEHEM
jgi:protein O-GlcNAc transferase